MQKKGADTMKLERGGGFTRTTKFANLVCGFTLIEILIIIGIVAGIFVFSAPYTLTFYQRQIIEEAQNNIIDALQRARHNAVLQKNDSDFGVTLSEVPGSYVIFQGSSYAARDAGQDEIFPIISSISVTGIEDVIFSKLTGLPSVTGTTTLISSNLSRGIFIGDSGFISKI